MKNYLATVYYRTTKSCNTWMVDVQCNNEEAAVHEIRRLFAKARPKAIKIDQIDIVPSTRFGDV